MQKLQKLTLVTAMAALLVSCGGKGGDDKNKQLTEKKAKLEELKKEQTKINDQITALQADIVKLDPASAKEEKTKLVAIQSVTPGSFTHYIDLQGKIESENTAYVTPRNGGGQVQAVYVKNGDNVRKGQLLLKLDDAVARKQLEQAQVQLDYAKDIYQRRQNLWKQNIGTEVELISARNNVESAERQIALLKEQLSFSNVYAEISGVADEVTIRVGEFFTGSPAAGHIRIVNTSNLKVTAQVPENYIGNVKVGTNVKINLPDISKTLSAKVSVAGKTIDPNSRSFYIEAKLPVDQALKPNQIALVQIQDYAAGNTITIPVNTLQSDEKGKFVMVAVKENGKLVARKKQVVEGQMYQDKVEIKSGLQAGDTVITEGFQGLYEGQLITTA